MSTSPRNGNRQPRSLRASKTFGRFRRLLIEPLESRRVLATVTWTGAGDGVTWGSSANWDRAGVVALPQSGDDVVIPNMGDPQVNGDVNIQFNTSISLNSLTSAEALTIVGGSLVLANASQIDGGLHLVGGSLSGNGVLTLQGDSEWSGGSMLTIAGKTVIGEFAKLTISSATQKSLARVLENAGTIDYVGSNLLFGVNITHPTGTINNLSAGTFNSIGEGDIVVGWSGGAINNSGAFVRYGVGNTTVSGIAFNNNGSIDVQAGLLQLASGGTTSGASSIVGGRVQLTGGTYTLQASTAVSGEGILNVAGGFLNVAGDSSVSRLHLTSGSLFGLGVLTVTGDSEWTGGFMLTPTGKTLIAETAKLTISGNTQKSLARVLETAGIIDYVGSNLLFGVDVTHPTGTINNLPSGTINAIGDGDIVLAWSSGAINNSGTFVRYGEGNTTVSGIAFNNNGSIDVQAGLLQLASGGLTTSKSSIVGGTVQLTGGTYTLQAGASVSGEGILQIAGGSLNAVAGNSTVNHIHLTSGSLYGLGTLTVTGDFEWSGGLMVSSVGKTVIGDSAKLTINSATQKYLARVLEIAGTVNYLGSNLLFGLDSNHPTGTINNLASGTINSIGEGDIVVGWSGGAINNQGLFNRSGGGTTLINGVLFNNSGVIDVQEGLLQAASGGTISGSASIIAGIVQLTGGTQTMTNGASVSGNGVLQVAGANLSLATNVAASVNNLHLSSGSISGEGVLTLQGNSEWSGGQMLSPTGKTAIGADATLAISGDSAKNLARVLENAGTVDYFGSNLLFGVNITHPTGMFNNSVSGTFNAVGDGDIVVGWSGGAFSNQGLFNRSGGGTTLINGVLFNNSGVIDVQEGLLQAASGGTISGSASIIAGIVQLTGGTQTVTNETSVSGNGVLQVAGANLSLATNVAASVNNLKLSAGSISGEGVLSLHGDSDWSGGQMLTPTGKTIVDVGAKLTISGNTAKYLARVLENSGTVDYSGSNLLFGLNSSHPTGTINNLTSGTINSIGEGDIVVGWSGGALNNQGLFNRSGVGTTTFSGVAFNNSGSIQVDEGIFQSSSGSASSLNDDRFLASSRNATMNLVGGIVGNTTNRQNFYPLGLTRVTGGSGVTPALLEAMSQDRGADSEGYSENFAFGTLELTSGFYRLVNNTDNYPGPGTEAVYVEKLVLPPAANLALNGIKLYVGSSSQINGTITGGSATVVFPAVIPVPKVSFSNTSQSVSEDAGTVNIGVHLNSPQTRRVTVPLTIGSSSTASAVRDFSLVNTEVTFEPGQTSATVQVEIIDDRDAESQEQIFVQLRNTAGIDLGPNNTHVISILDNDSPPGVSFTARTRSAVEGQVLTVEVQMDAVSNLDVTVPIVITGLSNPPADPALDLTLSNPSIVIPAGSQRGSISLTVIDDAIAEKAESFRLSFGAIENAVPSTGFQAALQQIVTVAANDQSEVAFEVLTNGRPENAVVVPIKVTMTPAASYPVTVNFTRQGTASTSDVTLTPSNSVTFAPGETTAFIHATIQDDTDLEDVESLVLTLMPQFSQGNAFSLKPGRSQYRMQIIDNEARLAQFPVSSQSKWEDAGTINAVVSLPFTRSQPTTFRVKVTGATASTGMALRNQSNSTLNDFSFPTTGVGGQVGAGSSVTIPAGQLSITIPIQIIDDNRNEITEKIVLTLDDREFTTNVGLPSNLGSRKQHTIYIQDNDPNITITRVASSVSEGTPSHPQVIGPPFTPLSLTINLSAPTNRNVVVPINFTRIENGRTVVNGTASLGNDFLPVATAISVLSGRTTGFAQIALVQADKLDEPNETVVARFGSPVGGGILTNSSSTFTILDDDSPPTVSFKTANGIGIYEGNSGSFEVQLSGNATQVESSVKVNFSTITAKRNIDYTVSGLSSGDRLVFPPGIRKKTFSISAKNDNVGEPKESFSIWLSEAQNVSLSHPDNRIRSSQICDVVSQTSPSLGSLAINTEVTFCGTLQSGLTQSGSTPSGSTPIITNGSLAIFSGPISGSTTFFDSNFNGIRDFLDLNNNGLWDVNEPLEPIATTDQAGQLQFPFSESFDRDGNGVLSENEGRWIAEGGLDVTTGLPWRLPLFAPVGLSSITPLTSLVEAMVRLHGLSVQQASDRTLAAMGAEGGSLAIDNIRNLILADDQQSAELYTELIKLSNSAISIADLFHGAAPDLPFEFFAEQVFAALAERIVEPDSLLELNDGFTWEDVIENVSRLTGFDLHADPLVHSEIVMGAALILSETNQALSDVPVTMDRQFVEELTRIKKVVQGAIAASLKQVGQGAIAIQDAIAAHTGANLQNQIAAAVIGNVFPPLLQVNDAQVIEGDDGSSLLEFTVELIGEHAETISVDYATGDLSATAHDNDYLPESGTLTWLPGDNTSRVVQVSVVGDSNFEFDEQIVLALSNPSNAAFSRQLATGRILSDDSMTLSLPGDTDSNLVTVQTDGEEFHLLLNDDLVHSGQSNSPVHSVLVGSNLVDNQFEFLMQGDLTRADRFDLQGGTDAGVDTVQWRNGNFSEIVHRIDHDGSGRTLFNPSGVQMDPHHLQFSWSDIEDFRLVFGDTDRLVFELEPCVTAVHLEDADPTDLIPGLGGMMRMFSPTGQFSPVLFNPSMGELIVRGYFESSALTVDSTDPLLVVVPQHEQLFDTTAPASQVLALPAESYYQFEVNWSGTDEDCGSGVASYDVYVSTNPNGPYSAWLSNTTSTSQTFVGTPGATYYFYSVARDSAGNLEQTPSSYQAMTIVAEFSQVATASVYHAGSSFASSGTSNAIDTTKVLAREGQAPQLLGFNNLINSSRGINGLVLDINGVLQTLTPSDFVFQMSPTGAFLEVNHQPQDWSIAPPPSSITHEPGVSDRIVIQWPNNVISNRWLRVTVLANANTGLAAPEVYYIGHLLGETTGATNGIYTVAFADITPIRSSVGQSVNAGSIADIDKNGTVSFADISAMRSNVGAQLTNITIPAAGNTGGQTLLSSGGGNERPKKSDLKGIHFDDSWPQMVPLIDEVQADFSSRITEKVDSQCLRREDAAVVGIGHAVIGHAVTAELSARRETAAVDWVFSAMGGRSGRSEVIAELELEDALEEVELLALGTLERSSWFPPK